MIFASDLVDWNTLGQVALISACAGLGVALALGLAVVASLRGQDERVAGRDAAALGFNVAMVLAVLVVVAASATGIYYITDK